MDRRGWPWKKKSSDKNLIASPDSSVSNGSTLSSLASLGDQESYKKVNYVQITMDAYSHFTGLEDQVKALKNQVKLSEDQVNDLKERIELSEDEIRVLKENVKFSEDEVKGLKEKLSAANLEICNKDGLIKQHVKVAEEAVSGWEKADAEALALKWQLESVTLLKLTAEDKASHLDGALKECMRQIRKMREENELKLQEAKNYETILEAKIEDFDQKLLHAKAENTLLLKSLEERSDAIIRINEEKSQCRAENEYLKANIQSYEQEIKSLKYELHVVSKEVEIRNEEKNMSMRSAEVANKQHLEDVKYIAKLEAECQRLRGLVRKKLPGPAALAQMKLEVENFDSETRIQKTKAKNTEDLQQSYKEIEFLTTRLLAMEEESKILKEALASRNNELQDSRISFAKLKSSEAHIHAINQQNSPNSNVGISTEVSLTRRQKNPGSCISVSEDGFDEEGSSAESWTPSKSVDNSNKSLETNNLELMDDFLEMEILASLSSSKAKDKVSVEGVRIGEFSNEQNPNLISIQNQDSPSIKSSTQSETGTEDLALLKLHSKISKILKSQTKDFNTEKVLEEIKCVILEIQSSLAWHPIGHLSDSSEGFCDVTTDHNLAAAISQIHEFVLLLGREVIRVQDDGHGLAKNLDDFSTTFNNSILNKESLIDFVLKVSCVFGKFDGVKFHVLNGEANACDYVDKVTLLENKVFQDDLSNKSCANGYCQTSQWTDNEFSRENNASMKFSSDISPCKCSLEEWKHLKLEKDKLVDELANCAESLGDAKLKMQELEQQLGELKPKLDLSEKQSSLVETQLKCMTESYKLLEMRARDLESEMKLLEEKNTMLENDLLVEKQNCDNALGRCKVLQDKLQRNDNCPTCSTSSTGDSDVKSKQEKEIVATAEKLAECQQTINFLGKQLKSLLSQKETSTSQHVDYSSSRFDGFGNYDIVRR
ncbi:hypothetical protein ACFE04_023826 [Oxalis oulophora]